MAHAPKVSVVVPNYNHARFLPSRLESIFAQSFQDFELIFLDDASTDDSRAVFERYSGDARVRAVFNDENSGSPFAQWNRGVALARGQYVWIAESDDQAEPELLATLVDLLDRNTDAGVAYCGSVVIDEEDTVHGPYRMPFPPGVQERWDRDFTASGKEEVAQFMFQTNTIPNASAALFRRDVYREAGDAETAYRLCGDWLQWIKMLLVADVCYAARPLNRFRRHRKSARQSYARTITRGLEAIRVQQFVLRRLPLGLKQRHHGISRSCGQWLEWVRAGENLFSASSHWTMFQHCCQASWRLAARFAGSLPLAITSGVARRIGSSFGPGPAERESCA